MNWGFHREKGVCSLALKEYFVGSVIIYVPVSIFSIYVVLIPYSFDLCPKPISKPSGLMVLSSISEYSQ